MIVGSNKDPGEQANRHSQVEAEVAEQGRASRLGLKEARTLFFPDSTLAHDVALEQSAVIQTQPALQSKQVADRPPQIRKHATSLCAGRRARAGKAATHVPCGMSPGVAS